MNLVAMTQRVTVSLEYAERRDALDHRWYKFLSAAGLNGIALPNYPSHAIKIFENLPISGLLLTGGNSPVEYGGDSPERDETEIMLVNRAMEIGIPVIGVCRGMQMIQLIHNGKLVTIKGHVMPKMSISYYGNKRIVNSYHQLAIIEAPNEFKVFASSSDGVIKGYASGNIHGIMWHPERMKKFDEEDINMFKKVFEK